MARPVILVDDDPAIRASLAFSLGLEGFEVGLFESAEQLLARHPLPPAVCLVLDYRLPAMDGLALLEHLRERGCRLPAVIVTSTPAGSLRGRAAAAGALLIEKPLMCDALSAAIRSLAAPITA